MDTDLVRELGIEREIELRPRLVRDPDDDDTTLEGEEADVPTKPSPGAALRAAAVTTWPSIAFDALLGAGALGVAIDALARPAETRKGRVLRTAAALGSLAAWGYMLGVRPWHRTWGASERECRSTLAGDGIIPRPTSEATRAITIEAPASYVWPWLMQLGQGRGGFYSYDWLENLAGLDIHTADEILPEHQHLVAGDEIPFGMGTGIPVLRLEHERALVLGASIDLATGRTVGTGEPDPERFVSMTWAFILRPIDDTSTRLVARFRLEQRPRGIMSATYPLLIEIPHFVMERKMLLGIRDRAERLYLNDMA